MKFLRGFTYAGRGLWHCLRQERNFRIHLSAAVYVLLLAPYFSLTRAEWGVLLLIIGLVIAMEAMNTAVERAVNLASPGLHPWARAAKDAAAGGVLVCCIAALFVGVLLFARPEGFQRLWEDFRQCLWKPVLLLFSLPAALWFIVGGGAKPAQPSSSDTEDPL